VRQLADPVPVEFIRDFQYSVIHAPVPDEFMARAIEESRALDAATWQGLMAGMLATPAASRLGDHGIPTWLVWGDRDQLASAKEREALGRQAGAHRRTIYRDTGHTPQWERPEAFARDLESFIARSGAGTTSRRSR
jgi:pimeloyl-ACP methyl ester carboxylesterase